MALRAARRGPLIAAAVGAVIAAVPACSNQKMVQGECGQLEGENVCAWGTMQGGRLVAFGATVPLAAVENAPAEAEGAWPPKADLVLALPAEVKTASGFSNVTIYWEPHGHPPGPYLTPHFDFHFNAADVSAISCADTTKPAAIPAGYELPDIDMGQMGTLVGLCVPGMGMHAVDSAELHSTGLFEKTMIVGYYAQQPIFVEPMLTKSTLMQERSFTLDVPAVAGAPAGVRFPTTFNAVYDSTARAYKFTFAGFATAAT